jgi:hypothetical protein
VAFGKEKAPPYSVVVENVLEVKSVETAVRDNVRSVRRQQHD